MTHRIIVGAPGSGKSTGLLGELLKLVHDGVAILLLDPHGTLAYAFMQYLVRLGLQDRVVYDRLKDTDRVLGWKFLTRPTEGNEAERRKQEDEQIRGFMDFIMWRRGVTNSFEHQYMERGCLFALKLVMRQPPDVPFRMLQYALKTETHQFHSLVKSCTDPYLQKEAIRLSKWPPSRKERELEPAVRLIDAVFEAPILDFRFDGEFDPGAHYENGGIAIIEGDTSVSANSMRNMMGCALFNAIGWKKRGGKNSLVVVVEEADHYGLVTEYLTSAINQYRKKEIEFWLVSQSAAWQEEIRKKLFQGCEEHLWNKCGDADTAALAAQDIGIPSLNPKEVEYTEERAIPIGHEETVIGHGDDKRPVSRVAYGKQIVERYRSLRDQLYLKQQELMKLKPGWRFFRSESESKLEYVKMLLPPFPRVFRDLGIRRTEEAIQEIKNRSEFRPPWQSLKNDAKTQSQSEENGSNGSSKNAGKGRNRSKSSKKKSKELPRRPGTKSRRGLQKPSSDNGNSGSSGKS